jgi:hypothetical protein
LGYVAGGGARWKCLDAKLEEGAANAAVAFEHAQIHSAPVIGNVRRGFTTDGAVIDVGVLQEQRLHGFGMGGKETKRKKDEDGDGRARRMRFVHGRSRGVVRG